MSAPSLTIRGLHKAFNHLVRTRGRGLTLKKFKKEQPRVVFEDFNLSLAPGEKVLLQGTNGCGKTTLLKLIGGLFPFESGEILIGEKGTPKTARSQIGLMLSFEMLYLSLSGWENLEFSGRLHRIPQLSETIERVASFWRFERHLDTPVHSYSYGLRARLSAARATLHNPKLLLLDEPTVGLDKEGCEILIDYLSKTDATVLLATHQPELFGKVASRSISLT